MEWLNKFLAKESTMFKIVTVLLGLVPLILFVIYGGFFRNITWQGLSIKDIGVLSVIYFINQILNRVNGRRNGKYAETDNNPDVQKAEQQVKGNYFTLEEEDFVIDCVDELNVKKQNIRNKQKTYEHILELRKQKRDLRYKGKPFAHIDEIIKELELEENYLIDNTYVPYDYIDILDTNVHSEKTKSHNDGSVLKNNVVTDGLKRSSIMYSFQALGVGSLTLGFVWTLPLDVTIAFIVALILSTLISLPLHYLFARLSTRGGYLTALTEKIKIQTDIRTRLDDRTHEVALKPTLEQFVIDNSLEVKNALEEEL